MKSSQLNLKFPLNYQLLLTLSLLLLFHFPMFNFPKDPNLNSYVHFPHCFIAFLELKIIWKGNDQIALLNLHYWLGSNQIELLEHDEENLRSKKDCLTEY